MNYLWDDQLHLFRNPHIRDFTYSDGKEVEARLLAVVSNASDRSTFSQELVGAIVDWPSEYHLSRSRHCLVRPLDILPGQKVLELGCGCGAITRYLGEIGAEVVAVEGSLARARVSAERCRDLSNVRVVVEDLLRFETEERFDWVLLIGVLEYAAMFSDREDPFQHYLQSVAQFLGPRGRLVVAIENKLGLKYLNGCEEDHMGIPFYGVQNLYDRRTPRTFGRQELIKQLSNAGLAYSKFFYPFPDYKLPSVILSDDAFGHSTFDPVDLLARCHVRDYSGSLYRSFDEALAFSALGSNGLIGDLSNSFLAVAAYEPVIEPQDQTIATAFSVHRAAEFTTQTSFIRQGSELQVSKTRLVPNYASHSFELGDMCITSQVLESEYRPGRQLLWDLLRARAKKSDRDSIVQALHPWMEFLLRHARTPVPQLATSSLSKVQSLSAYVLPGNFVDCTPFNVLQGKEGLFTIDAEWQSNTDVLLGWIVTRGLLWSLLAGVPREDHFVSLTEIIEELCARHSLSVSSQDIHAWLDLEAKFQTKVLGHGCWDLLATPTSSGMRSFSGEITGLQQTVSMLNQAVAEREMALEQAIELTANLRVEHQGEIAEQQLEIEDFVRQTTGLTSKLEQQSEEAKQLKSEITNLHSRTHELAGEYERELQAAKSTSEDQQRQVRELEAHLRELSGKMEETQRTLIQALNSKSWRATEPLRTLSRRFPGLGKNLQRILRFAWWTVSLQLIQRLESRRKARSQIVLLSTSVLFDQAWYLEEHADVAAANVDAAEHFFWFGAAGGFDPHPLFDTDWYVSQHTEVSTSGLNPLVHYLKIGAKAGYDPHPLFDTRWYLGRYPAVAESGLNPLIHYLQIGAMKGYSPHPWFDNDKYLFEYPEASLGRQAPLIHYLLVGSKKQYDPHPLFDSKWYSLKYSDQLRGTDPLVHYVTSGRSMGCSPSLLFENGTCERASLESISFPTSADPDVSIIIPVYRSYCDTYRCLCSLMLHTGSNVTYEVVVADDCPEHRATSLLDKSCGIRIELNQSNLGFLRTCNSAAKKARGRFLVFLNNDTIVDPNWLDPLVRTAERDPSIGMVGGTLLNPDGMIQEAGGIIFNDGWGFPYGAGDDPNKCQYNYVRQVDCLIGACFLVRHDLFDQVGGFDIRYAPAFYEEFDLAFAIQELGYKVVYQPACKVTHLRGHSYSTEVREAQSQKNHTTFAEKWQSRLALQPSPTESLFIARESIKPRGIILVIDDKPPEFDKHAGGLTLYQYLQLFQSLGLRIVFCSEVNQPLQPYTTILQQQGIEVIYFPERLEEWIQQNGMHLDYVWTARPDVTTNILGLLTIHTHATILYYTHDLHYLRELRRYQLERDPLVLQESDRLKEVESAIFRKVDVIMTPSMEEISFIRQAAPAAQVREVLPYFFPPAAITGFTDFALRTDMIFVGGYDHRPNVDAALWLVSEIMPLVWRDLPDARVMIVGSNPPETVKALQSERVQVTGYVPDLAPYYGRSRLSVNPLRYGAGVKGKLIESLRVGVPVVTTSVGNEGIGLIDGVDALVADSAQALSEKILLLYGNDQLCQTLADGGKSVIRRGFSTMKARHILTGILSKNVCVMCGEPTANESKPVREGVSWYDAPGCRSCNASNLALMLANVVLEPFRKQGFDNILAASAHICRLHIDESGLLSRHLSEAVSLSADHWPDADYDLIVSPDWRILGQITFETVCGLASKLAPGGRLIGTSLDIDALQTAWRRRDCAGQMTKSLNMVIHEIAPSGADPYVGILEVCRVG